MDRYYKASYDYDSCRKLSKCELTTGEIEGLAGTMDTEGYFDRASGVLINCRECLLSVEVRQKLFTSTFLPLS